MTDDTKHEYMQLKAAGNRQYAVQKTDRDVVDCCGQASSEERSRVYRVSALSGLVIAGCLLNCTGRS